VWDCGGKAKLCLTSAIDGGNLSASRTDRFTPGGRPPLPIRLEAWWASESLWKLWNREKSLAPAVNRTPAVKPVVYRYAKLNKSESGCLLVLVFGTEDGGSAFHRNVSKKSIRLYSVASQNIADRFIFSWTFFFLKVLRNASIPNYSNPPPPRLSQTLV
jgi:hypothetical protein